MITLTRNAVKPARKTMHDIDKATASAALKADRAISQVMDVVNDYWKEGGAAVRSVHDRIESKPHVAVLAALAAGVLFGAFYRIRR
jgi:ElaB/YqjD/DUF883 family membrane-anchored ribosome-binding protein